MTSSVEVPYKLTRLSQVMSVTLPQRPPQSTSTLQTHTHSLSHGVILRSAAGRQNVCISVETVCLWTAFCLCDVWVTAEKRFPIFRPLKTNLCLCVCMCVRVCVCVCVLSLSKGSPLQRETLPFVQRLGLSSAYWVYGECPYVMTDE